MGSCRCLASVGVTNVPVAPESRIAVRGWATSVKSSSETISLEVLITECPTCQAGGIQKQRLVLPPCMLLKVAVVWWPGNLLLQSVLLWAQAP